MPSVDERLASLEGRVDVMAHLPGVVSELRGDVNRQFTELRGDMNRQFTELRVEMRTRFSEANARITELRDDVNRRIGSLDAKGDRHFVWLMGMMVTGFIAVIGALVGVVYR